EGATTLIGGGAGDILFAAGATGDLLVAGSGNTTLSGGTSTGNNTFMSGSGNDLIIGGIGSDTIFAGGGDDTVFGGGGADVYNFLNALTTGGSFTIGDFAPGADKIDLSGYKGSINQLLNSQVNTPAGTIISLSDGTQITFTGLDELKRSDIV
ncbi:MAG TPA: calcium-binding protein, partial [Roseomonas sp.]